MSSFVDSSTLTFVFPAIFFPQITRRIDMWLSRYISIMPEYLYIHLPNYISCTTKWSGDNLSRSWFKCEGINRMPNCGYRGYLLLSGAHYNFYHIAPNSSSICSTVFCHDLWSDCHQTWIMCFMSSCQLRKIVGCACARNARNVFPASAG